MSILQSGAGSKCRRASPSKLCTMSFKPSWAGPIIICTTSSSEMSCMARPRPEDRDIHDGRKIKLSTALVDGERAFQYLYDYGDGWCCIVVLEAVAPMVPGVVYPRL